MFDKVRDLLGEKEPVVVEEIDSADELLLQEKAHEIDSIEEQASDFKDRSEEIIQDLKQDLKELKGFEDRERRDVIEDVISNIVEEREKLAENFSSSEEPGELYREVDGFIQDFRSMSRKEAAVMEEANMKDRFSSQLGKFENLKSNLEDFLEDEHKTRERHRKIERKIQEKKELEGKMEETRDQLEEADAKSLEKELAEREGELQELEESQLRQEYQQIIDDLEKSKREKNKMERKIGEATGKMERGLKKMLYEGKISSISREGSEILRDIRDRNKEELLERDPQEVEKAAEKARNSADGDFLDDSTGEKLSEGAETLESMSEIQDNLNEKKVKISELEKEKEEHEFNQEKQRLEKEISQIKEKLEQQNRRKTELQERKEKIEDSLNSLEQDILQIMKSEFNRPVEKKD